jgi:hypothetical protein
MVFKKRGGSMTLEAWQWGNPETVAIRREEAALRKLKNCSGCKHHQSMEFEGEKLHRCAVKRFGFGTPNCSQKVMIKTIAVKPMKSTISLKKTLGFINENAQP